MIISYKTDQIKHFCALHMRYFSSDLPSSKIENCVCACSANSNAWNILLWSSWSYNRILLILLIGTESCPQAFIQSFAPPPIIHGYVLKENNPWISFLHACTSTTCYNVALHWHYCKLNDCVILPGVCYPPTANKKLLLCHYHLWKVSICYYTLSL